MAEFVNKVAESGLITIDLEDWFPKGEITVFDLKDYLFMGMIVKEKEFREALKNTDWETFRDKTISIICSADAIIPSWAFMLVAAYLQPVCKELALANPEELRKQLFIRNLQAINPADYKDQRVIIKGCGDTPIGDYAYLEATRILRPVVKSLMFGEPCSTVPVYKRQRTDQ
ncbi:MAG: DUF2480 family protein [Bacteroidetes bacterium]|nr:DUF2480 family protein [Bacteroidota bacterium]